MKSVVRVAGMMVAALALGAAAPAPVDTSLRLVDVTAEFDRIATATAGLDDKNRAAAFEKESAGLADGFYARSRSNERYDYRVLRGLKEWPLQRTAILDVSHRFESLLTPAKASFEQAFGTVRFEQPVYLVHSLGEMDGGTRQLNGKETLVFGADVIARIHGGHDLTPLFHHELFHVLHGQSFGNCDPLWCSLWEEGLATYTAAKLNPAAGDGALLLDFPKPIRPAVDANRTAAFCALLPRLDDTDGKNYGPFFMGNQNVDGFPARMGYYLGYLVVADIGQRHSLKELEAMPQAQARAEIGASIKKMADCSAKA